MSSQHHPQPSATPRHRGGRALSGAAIAALALSAPAVGLAVTGGLLSAPSSAATPSGEGSLLTFNAGHAPLCGAAFTAARGTLAFDNDKLRDTGTITVASDAFVPGNAPPRQGLGDAAPARHAVGTLGTPTAVAGTTAAVAPAAFHVAPATFARNDITAVPDAFHTVPVAFHQVPEAFHADPAAFHTVPDDAQAGRRDAADEC